jgi:hypothetical protein
LKAKPMMTPMRRFTATAAALLALAPGLAQAAEPPCLTPGEFTSLADYAMPSILSGTAQRCDAALGPSAFLRNGGIALIQRYAERKSAAWPGAKAAVLKLGTSLGGDTNHLFQTMPDASLQPIVDSLLQGIVAQQVPLDRCGVIDRAIGLLAPLPPQSTAELIALAVGLGAKAGRAKLGAISICEA